MFLRQFQRTAVVAGAIFLAGLGQGQAGERKTGVVELFTSQGCSSCPPADLFAGDLAGRDELLVLSLPVDYWDFLGWKDTLASPAYSERQRAYARSRRDRNVYTPQMVVNGRAHAIGSYRDEVEDLIAETADDFEKERVEVDIAVDGNRLKVSIGDGKEAVQVKDATIWLVLYTHKETVNIGRGENHGRKITYTNVVRELTPIGMWSGKAKEITLPRDDLMQASYDGCAVIVQAHDTGPIYGAASIDTARIN
jgi:hypothetical protein